MTRIKRKRLGRSLWWPLLQARGNRPHRPSATCQYRSGARRLPPFAGIVMLLRGPIAGNAAAREQNQRSARWPTRCKRFPIDERDLGTPKPGPLNLSEFPVRPARKRFPHRYVLRDIRSRFGRVHSPTRVTQNAHPFCRRSAFPTAGLEPHPCGFQTQRIRSRGPFNVICGSAFHEQLSSRGD